MDYHTLWLVVVCVGLSLCLNVVLAVVVVFVVRQNRAIAVGAFASTQEAMDSLLALANLPAASFRETMRERSLKRVIEGPVERERTVMN